ncbi:MAG: TlpA family protein disulfide reductase [Elusimicrobiaceae bacterium]|nr:TlpA family protein disulfide reductase [Elusimicrobiaceae bacterium]
MKIKALLLTLSAAVLLGACVNVPQPPKLNVSLPVAGEESVWVSADQKGKPVLIAVMASYCGWCKKSLAALEIANKEYGDKVEVIGVFVDNDEAKVKEIIKQYNLESKILYNGRQTAEDLGVQGFPHIMLFNGKHKLVKYWGGYSDTLADQYRTELNKLVK